MSPKPPAMSPALTLPKRLSILSLVGGSGGSSSLKRMSTYKVSKSTDALSSLDSPSILVDAPSTPVALTRTRGGLRSSFMNLLRPTFGSHRRPSSPAMQPSTPGPASRPLTLARGRRSSDSSNDLLCSAEVDDNEEDDSIVSSSGSVSAWTGMMSTERNDKRKYYTK